MIGPTRDDDAEEQADDERTAARAERQLAATRQWKSHGAEREPGGDADREPGRVDLGQAALGVAEHSGDVADRFGRSDDSHSVTQRQHGVVVGDDVVVAAPDSGHRYAVPADEVEVDESLAREAAVRDEDPPEVERRAVERKMAVAALADVDAESLDLVGRPDHHKCVAGHRQVVVDRDRHDAVVADPAEADVVAITQLAQRGHAGRADRDRPVDEIGRLRGRWGRFERCRKAEPATDQQREDEQHRHHRGRIGERVGDHRVAVVDCLDRRLQRWRVRRTAGEQSRPFCGGEPEPCRDCAHDGGERADQRDGDGDGADAAPPKAGEERRPRGKADRVREQHETELAEDGEPIGAAQRLVDRANGETDEQRAGRADGDSPDPDASDRGTDADDQRTRAGRDRPRDKSTTGPSVGTPAQAVVPAVRLVTLERWRPPRVRARAGGSSSSGSPPSRMHVGMDDDAESRHHWRHGSSLVRAARGSRAMGRRDGGLVQARRRSLV